MTFNRKRVIAIAVGVLAHSVAAQTPAPIRSYPFQAMRDEMLRETHPTTRQLELVDSIASAYLDRMHALDPVMRTKSRGEINKNLIALQVEQAKDIRRILTDVQRRVFDKNYDAWAQRRGLPTSSSAPRRSPSDGVGAAPQFDRRSVPG